jgi:sugar O-acyltransferase (sialic acid O-acetyltransferase NeuD family)
MKKVIVIGSGGHAKVVIDILREMTGVNIVGVTSNSLAINSSFCGIPVIGEDIMIKNFKNEDNYFVAMGLGGYRDNFLRERVYYLVKSFGMTFINAIHPSAIISKSVMLGEGVVIFPGVIINTDVRIGNNTIIATGSTIDHETLIEDHVLISAGVTVGAYSVLKESCLLALGSKIISGVTVGSNTLVAAGAMVVKNIGDNKRVYGIPAKEKD